MHTLFQNLKRENYIKNIEKASKLTSIFFKCAFSFKIRNSYNDDILVIQKLQRI